MHQPGRGIPARQHQHELAGQQLGLAHVIGQQAHAHPAEHGEFEGEQVISHQAGWVCPFVALAVRPQQRPGDASVGGGHGDGVEPIQVCSKRWLALAFQLGRGAHQQRLAAAQALDDQAAAVDQRRPHAQGHINAIFHQIDHTVGDLHVDPDLRVTRHVLGDQLAHDRLGQRDRAAHPQHATWFGMHAGDHVGSRFGFFAHGHAVAQVLCAHVGQGQAARGALQQAHPQARFEFGHPARETRGGQAQRSTSGRKAAALHHFGEKQHVVEVLHGLVRCRLFY